MTMLPNFLGIGAKKAGSTWLWANMIQHPEIFLPPNKEIHFFDWNFHKGIDWYANHFTSSTSKVKGDMTPDYSGLPVERIALVKKYMPKVKIILLLRHPVDRAWSHAVMDLATLRGRSVDDVTHEEFMEHFNSSESRDKGSYPKIIKNWSKYFSKKQLFVEHFSKIKNAPEQLLNDIFTFVGVHRVESFDNYPARVKVLPNQRQYDVIPSISDKHYEYLLSMYKNDIQLMKTLDFHFDTDS